MDISVKKKIITLEYSSPTKCHVVWSEFHMDSTMYPKNYDLSKYLHVSDSKTQRRWLIPAEDVSQHSWDSHSVYS
jgi:hypothetical protein